MENHQNYSSTIPASVIFRSSALIGLAMYPFMPTSKAFLRSSLNAFAVIAIIGISARRLSSSFRMIMVAL